MANTNINVRVQRHRDALRRAGLRPAQIWVPDTRRFDFAAECSRQSRLVALADAADHYVQPMMEEALEGVDGWTA